jgi:hypothetical protein
MCIAEPAPRSGALSPTLCARRWLLAGLLVLTPPLAADSEDCVPCHTGPDAEAPAVDAALLSTSVHDTLDCLDCHAAAAEVPHPKPLAASACADCHPEPAEQLAASVHRPTAAGPARPGCPDCHGSAHQMRAAADPDSPVFQLNLPATCGSCHSGPPDAAGPPRVYRSYMDSIHGHGLSHSGLLVAANCSNCHGAHDIRSSADPASRLARPRVATTCGVCHQGIRTAYLEGSHGRRLAAGDQNVPSCSDCHRAHRICRPHQDPCRLEVVEGCGDCHRGSLRSYRDTLHGQVTALGYGMVARCADCHGAHRVLPASDARSQIAPGNLVATCRRCHPGANANFVLYAPHANPDDRERNPWLYYAARSMHGLILAVFSFFGLHTLLWLVRSLLERTRAKHPGR